jgi:hypothetical protein
VLQGNGSSKCGGEGYGEWCGSHGVVFPYYEIPLDCTHHASYHHHKFLQTCVWGVASNY